MDVVGAAVEVGEDGADDGAKDVLEDRATVMENDPSLLDVGAVTKGEEEGVNDGQSMPVSSSSDRVGAAVINDSSCTLGPKSPSTTGGTVGPMMNGSIEDTLVGGEVLD